MKSGKRPGYIISTSLSKPDFACSMEASENAQRVTWINESMSSKSMVDYLLQMCVTMDISLPH